MTQSREWFTALLDAASDVYFRYAIEPTPRLAYISPSVRALTGRAPEEFYDHPDLCLSVVVAGDRRLVRRLLRARRSTVVALHVLRDGIAIPVEVRTVAVVRHRRLVAVEGVARLALAPYGDRSVPGRVQTEATEPIQQRLAALMFEVHDLLHRVGVTHSSPHVVAGGSSSSASREHADGLGASRPPLVLRLGDLALDCDRLIVTESGRPVALTPREIQVLRYLLDRQGRVVTRARLLSDVWHYDYTGDDRTVDVHVSRLRRKLPSLSGRLTAIRGIGYRVEADAPDLRIASS